MNTNASSPTPKASIIVVTHNNLQTYTQPCLETLLKTTDPNLHEIILVDNGSTDETLEWIEEQRTHHPQLKLFANKKNLGFAAGNNRGLQQALGDVIILLNNDTLLPPGWIEPLITPFEEHPTLGLLGPVTNHIGSFQQITLPGYDTTHTWQDAAIRYMKRHSGTLIDIPSICFFCVAISRRCLDSVGLLDEQFRCGNFEDDDYCARVLQHGLRIAYTDASFVWHYGGATLAQLSQKTQSATWYKNKCYYTAKHGQAPLLTSRARTGLNIIKTLLETLPDCESKNYLTNLPNTEQQTTPVDPLIDIERCIAHMSYLYEVLNQLGYIEKESLTLKGTLVRMAKHIDSKLFGSFFKSLFYTETKPNRIS